MHWFWRAVIAVGVTAAVFLMLEDEIESLQRAVRIRMATFGAVATFAPDGSLIQASEPSEMERLWFRSKGAVQLADTRSRARRAATSPLICEEPSSIS